MSTEVVGEMARADVMMDMLFERELAFKKYGDQHERTKEIWMEIVTARTKLIRLALPHDELLYTEVLQAATVLMAWAENLVQEENRG